MNGTGSIASELCTRTGLRSSRDVSRNSSETQHKNGSIETLQVAQHSTVTSHRKNKNKNLQESNFSLQQRPLSRTCCVARESEISHSLSYLLPGKGLILGATVTMKGCKWCCCLLSSTLLHFCRINTSKSINVEGQICILSQKGAEYWTKFNNSLTDYKFEFLPKLWKSQQEKGCFLRRIHLLSSVFPLFIRAKHAQILLAHIISQVGDSKSIIRYSCAV